MAEIEISKKGDAPSQPETQDDVKMGDTQEEPSPSRAEVPTVPVREATSPPPPAVAANGETKKADAEMEVDDEGGAKEAEVVKSDEVKESTAATAPAEAAKTEAAALIAADEDDAVEY